MLGDIVGSVDEPAKDYGVVPVGQQALDFGDELGEFAVELGATEVVGGLGEVEETAPLTLRGSGLLVWVSGVSSRSDIDAFEGLVVGRVEHCGASKGVCFFDRRRLCRCCPGPKGCGCGPRG